MNCFVAMAFGRTDTDKVYDDLICPVLAARNITPIRVDRLEHNENIDDKIMQGLREATFVIADLTYARPSVYFEAGFAERIVPVIYTARRDHFVPRADDVFGNLRVHFDLLMRNIIDWTGTDDPLFSQRLGRRIDDVLAPINQRSARDEVERAHERDFQAISYSDRIREVKNEAERVLASGAFGLSRKQALKYDNLYEVVVGETLHFITTDFVGEYEGRTSFREQPSYYGRIQELDYNIGDCLPSLSRVHQHRFVFSLEVHTFADVCAALASFRPIASTTILQHEGTIDVPAPSQKVTGPVFYPIWGKNRMWTGIETGACVQNPPLGIAVDEIRYAIKHPPSFRVISCSTRKLPFITTYGLIDNISSINSFAERFRLMIRHSFNEGLKNEG